MKPPTACLSYRETLWTVAALAILLARNNPAFAQAPNVTLSPPGLAFGSQPLNGTSGIQPVTLANAGSSGLTLGNIVLTGTFYGDFAQTNNCPMTILPGARCTINIAFTPSGTGARTAILLVFDNAVNSPQAVMLSGSGIASCASLSDCAFQVLNSRVAANRASFFVYKDADSAFNHGYPSGLFGNIDLGTALKQKRLIIDPSCIDDPASSNGCSADPARLDAARTTVFRFVYPPLAGSQFVGLNFVDPDKFDPATLRARGYNLTPATALRFDARSPDGANVQFGVGGCVTGFSRFPSAWTQITISLLDLLPPPGPTASVCPPDLTNTNIVFAIATNGVQSANGGTVLVDNVEFLPVPARQATDPLALTLPLGNLTFGTVLQAATTPDQANRNLAPIYESAATILALLKRGQPGDMASALEIADALHYALLRENHGDPLPIAPDGSAALHSAYEGGDLGFLNGQGTVTGTQAGDARLSGFSILGDTCGPTQFCLVLDGATGGNDAWAMLALTAAYLQSGDLKYLNDAETIGDWIANRLVDKRPDSYGGYYVGFSDSNQPKQLIPGKSTENNGDIFAAFSLLGQIESARGNAAAAADWVAKANYAGDFVIRMFDKVKGRFYAGTVLAGSKTDGFGNCQESGLVQGTDAINTCDFLDSNTFTVLPMAGSPRYRNSSQVDWRRPIQYMLDNFVQNISVDGQSYSGFDIVAKPTPDALNHPTPNGIAWEFTGQAIVSLRYVDQLYNQSTFENAADSFLAQIRQAQAMAPFGNGLGLPASTIQDGDLLPPAKQCLNTPFQCIPERVGLAATNWAIYADQSFNPLAFAALGLAPNALTFPDRLVGTASGPLSLVLTSRASAPVAFSKAIAVVGVNQSDFVERDDCAGASPLAASAFCTITVTFTPSAAGVRTAALQITDNALGSPQTVLLTGNGQPINDFSLSIAPFPQIAVAGNAASYNVTAALVRGQAEPITLSCASQLPCSVQPNVVAPGGTATVTVFTSYTTSPNTYKVTITGATSSAVNMVTAILMVQAPARISASALTFGAQLVGVPSQAQSVNLANDGNVSLPLAAVVLTGTTSGDFSQTNNCGTSLAPGASCSIAVTFMPTGTGARVASLLILDSLGKNLGAVALSGTGMSSCASIGACGLQFLNQRAAEGSNSFFVYKDADSGLNHGFPSGPFGNPQLDLTTIMLESGCVDDPAAPNGCSSNNLSLDSTRGTVFSLIFPPLHGNDFAGLNFQDPEDYNADGRIGYNLAPATDVLFDVRSPDGISVQFGVGGCVSPFFPISREWTRMSISLASLQAPPVVSPPSCPPDTRNVNLLFSVTTNAARAPQGGTVLLDNVEFTPTPSRQRTDAKALSFPLSTQTFGVVPQVRLPIPSDQVNRNVSTIYESALTLLALLERASPGDVGNALEIANTFHYALYHDNHGDPIPASLGSTSGCYDGAPAPQCGLHSAYIDGDIALLNNQKAPALGRAGDIRLAGFLSGTNLCGLSRFCLVLDGATGGNNAWAMLALLAAYRTSGNLNYLNDAVAIGSWIYATLADNSGMGIPGYFVGYNDGGSPKQLVMGKSTRFNAEIFAAFSALAQVESSLGSPSGVQWTARANLAGDFVIRMFDSKTGRFFAGTVNVAGAGNSAPGLCPDLTMQQGYDVVNACDSLDSDTSAILALATASRYSKFDWMQPLQYLLKTFNRTITAGGQTYSGFNLINSTSPAANGITWEFTAEAVQSLETLATVSNTTQFSGLVTSYLHEIRHAQMSAPFGNGMGLVASTLQDGDHLPQSRQCLVTPFECLPERPEIAATAWAIFVASGGNPFLPLGAAAAPALGISSSHSGPFVQGQQGATFTIVVLNALNAGPSSGAVTVTDAVPPGLVVVSMSGPGWTCSLNSCFRGDELAGGASYPAISVAVNVAPNAPARIVNLVTVSGGGSTPASASDATEVVPRRVERDFRGIGRSDIFLDDPNADYGYAGLSDGNGSFSYVYSFITPGFDKLRTGDYNGDGKADLILYNSTTAIGYLGFANGDGTFKFGPLYWSPGYSFVEIGDFNGDGKADVLLYRSSDGTMYVALGEGNGGFSYKYNLVTPGFTQIRVADFNGDGKADVLLYKADGSCYLGLSNGNGTFSFSPVLVAPGYTDVQVGDFNGDGKMDVLFYSKSTGVTAVGLSTGRGFTIATYGYSPGFTAARVADYTGDGRADVIFYNSNTAVAYFGTGDGAGAFTFQSLFWSPGYDWVEPQDLNGDGRIDVILYNSGTGTAYTAISNGSGGFSYSYSYWGIGKVLAR